MNDEFRMTNDPARSNVPVAMVAAAAGPLLRTQARAGRCGRPSWRHGSRGRSEPDWPSAPQGEKGVAQVVENQRPSGFVGLCRTFQFKKFMKTGARIQKPEGPRPDGRPG